jgi:hypothetical protein
MWEIGVHMQEKNAKILSIIADSINVGAALIGIFGFLTGISTLPSLLSGKGSQQTNASWFFGAIPFSVSFPVFIITLVFVYGLYFAVVFKANRWLFLRGLIKRWKPPHIVPLYSEERKVYGSRPADLFSVIFFASLGTAIGWLIFYAFFSSLMTNPASEIILLFLALPAIIALVSWLCIVAKNSASIG